MMLKLLIASRGESYDGVDRAFIAPPERGLAPVGACTVVVTANEERGFADDQPSDGSEFLYRIERHGAIVQASTRKHNVVDAGVSTVILGQSARYRAERGLYAT